MLVEWKEGGRGREEGEGRKGGRGRGKKGEHDQIQICNGNIIFKKIKKNWFHHNLIIYPLNTSL